VLSDTVILNSPTTTDRDRSVIGYLEQVLAVDAAAFGREMFERTSDLSSVPADEIVRRDVKRYEAAGQTLRIAQVETVGRALAARRDELMQALEAARAGVGDALAAGWSPTSEKAARSTSPAIAPPSRAPSAAVSRTAPST
jgi:manganese-dependent inorganic pyrophosphatase